METAIGPRVPRVGRAPLWTAALCPADRAVLDPGASLELDRRPYTIDASGVAREAGLGRVLLIEADRLASAASGGAGGALAPELHHLTDPPAFVELARSRLTCTAGSPRNGTTARSSGRRLGCCCCRTDHHRGFAPGPRSSCWTPAR